MRRLDEVSVKRDTDAVVEKPSHLEISVSHPSLSGHLQMETERTEGQRHSSLDSDYVASALPNVVVGRDQNTTDSDGGLTVQDG